jgi:hypothetical protein
MDTEIDLKAPTGKYRVVGVDTFDGTNWVENDYGNLEEATRIAKGLGGTMLKVHVYDDQGKHLFEAGTF